MRPTVQPGRPRPGRLRLGRLRTVTAAAVLAAVTALAGCAGGTAANSSGATPPTATAPAGGTAHASSSPSADAADRSAVRAARKAAGIRGCPASAADVAGRPDGLPDLRLSCLGGGKPVRLAGLRGTPSVINIWAQWCRPCRQEAPHLAAVAARAGGRVRFVGIDYEDPDPLAAIAFARSAGWHYPQLQDRQGTVRSPLRLIGVPATIFVDAAGRITYRHNGPFRSTTELTAAVRDHLGVSL